MSTKLGTCATQDCSLLPFVQSVQPGLNVTVNNTDPRNPIVSASGGGGYNYIDENTDYAAAIDDYVLTDTSGATFTVTLPTTPPNGATVIVADATKSWGTNHMIIAPGGGDLILTGGTTSSSYDSSVVGATLKLTYYLADTWWILEVVTGIPSVQSVVAGTNITVDDTDPLNPIVSSTGGGGGGTVTTVSVVNANGFNGTVANPTTTPAITLETTVTGLLKGASNALAAATSSDLPTITLTGDATGANSGGTIATTLANSGVTAGTYGDGFDIPIVVVNSKGLITGISTTGVSAGAGLAAAILADSPLNYWQCNETSGSTIIDYGSGAKNLTIQGTNTLNYTQIVNGFPALFSPTPLLYSSQNGARSSGLSYSPPVINCTVEAIYCPSQADTTLGGTSLIFSIVGDTVATSGSQYNMQISFRLSSAEMQAVWQYGTGSQQTINGPPLTNSRHHIAIVKNGTALTVSFYIDGALIVIAPYTNEVSGGGSCNYLIMANGAISGATLSEPGIVSNVVFWDSVISGTRIQAHAIASGYFL